MVSYGVRERVRGRIRNREKVWERECQRKGNTVREREEEEGE